MEHVFGLLVVFLFSVIIGALGISLAALWMAYLWWRGKRSATPLVPSTSEPPYRNPHQERRHYLTGEQLFTICKQISHESYVSGRFFTVREMLVLTGLFWRIMDKTCKPGISKTEWETMLRDDERDLLYYVTLGMPVPDGYILTEDTVLLNASYPIAYTGFIGPEVMEKPGLIRWVKMRWRLIRLQMKMNRRM